MLAYLLRVHYYTKINNFLKAKIYVDSASVHYGDNFELIATGLINQQIADKLFISNTTVETHRKNLLEKFKAKNVAMLINMASKNGFL